MPEDFRVSITNAPGEDAYPISSFTWLLVPDQIRTRPRRQAVKDFLTWMLTGRTEIYRRPGLRALPKEVVAKEQKAIAMIQ